MAALVEDDPSTSPPTPSMFAAPDPNINHSLSDQHENVQPIVSFGLIADIQYADHDDCWNYVKTHLRRYRNAARLADEACEYWSKGRYPISFILQLGDLIDGVSATDKKSEEDLNTILAPFNRTFPSLPIYHIWGNHEFYNFSRSDLFNGPLCSFPSKETRPGHYGTFEVCPRLRVIALDTYEFSALGVEETSDVYVQAMELLNKHNQNTSPNDPTGLRGHQRRFVQFNGGVTPKQLQWLKDQLTRAKDQREKVIITGRDTALLMVSIVILSFVWYLQVIFRFIQVPATLWIYFGITRKC